MAHPSSDSPFSVTLSEPDSAIGILLPNCKKNLSINIYVHTHIYVYLYSHMATYIYAYTHEHQRDMTKLCRIQRITAFLLEPCIAEGFYSFVLFFYFNLVVVDRSGVGEGKDARRLLHKAVVLLPSSEMSPPEDTEHRPPPPVLPGRGSRRCRGRHQLTPTGTLTSKSEVGKGRSWPPAPKQNEKGLTRGLCRLSVRGWVRECGDLCVCFFQETHRASWPSEIKRAVLKLSPPT